MNDTNGTPPFAREFVSTHWSVVRAAASADGEQSKRAMEQLCRAYWYPLYGYARRRGYTPEEAGDLAQGFFARLIGSDYFTRAEPSKGRFRWFLLTTFKYFLANEWDRAAAQKRGGGVRTVSLDDSEYRYVNERATEEPIEVFFDRRWALTVLELALAKLKSEFQTKGKERQFEVLRGVLAGTHEGHYASLAEELELEPAAIAVIVSRMRQRYRELVRSEVAQTVNSAAELEEELRYLRQLLTE